MCGYAFNQNYRYLKTIIQLPTCALPSKSTVDPNTSIELDNTTLDISCTQTKANIE